MSNHLTDLAFATSLIRRLCRISGDPELIDDLRYDLACSGVIAAVAAHDDEVLFNWLADCISYQGVSDAIAASYLELAQRYAHGAFPPPWPAAPPA